MAVNLSKRMAPTVMYVGRVEVRRVFSGAWYDRLS